MNQPLRFLLAPDSFKGSLSAIEFCNIASEAIQKLHPGAQIFSRPMSDGGEGFVDSFIAAGLAEGHSVWVSNPLGRKTKAQFAWQPQSRTAIIEMAQASGLPKIRPEERNPLQTHTYGTGQIIAAALELQPQRVILGLGGSATNDGGAGALQALGIPLMDKQNNELGLGGQALPNLGSIGDIPPALLEIEWELACDVTNPLLGPQGATAVFGPQKGVNQHNFDKLEAGLKNWAQCISDKTGKDVTEIPGAGAAGGMAAGFIGLLDAQVTPGFEILNQHLGLEGLIQKESIDWIFTGEGRIDDQTHFGKLPMRIAELGLKHQVPTIGLCGSLGCSPETLPEFRALFSIVNTPMHEIEAMQNAAPLLHQTLLSVLSLIPPSSNG